MGDYWSEHRDSVRKRLIEEFGYEGWEADDTLERLTNAHPDVQNAAIQWIETGELEGPSVAGFDASALVASERAGSPLAALLTIDWLLRDPEAALDSLRRPVDRLIVRRND